MTPDSNEPEGEGLSRRDFVRGRFWRAFQPRSASTNDARALAKKRKRIPLVMRYPQTLHQVGAADVGGAPTSESIPKSSVRRRAIPIFRPPGAIDEPSFLAGCTRCDECRKACPHDAIVHAPERMREAAGTPTIEADHQACLMCEDFPCIAACEPGVLTSLLPPTMGTAKVTEHMCLAYHGTTCTVCSERCPVEGAIDLTNGKPTVNESTCTGCGVCRYVCPAPENAILLMPAFLRPSIPSEST